MRICFLTHNLKQDNGAGVFSLRLINGLRQSLGCQIVVLTSQPGGNEFEQPILYPQKIKLLSQFFKIRKIIKSCDLIHSFDLFPYGIIAVLACLGLEKKIIITVVGSGSIIPLYQRFYSGLAVYCYKKAHKIISISHYTKVQILKKIKNLEIQVINPGIDFNSFNQGSQEAASKLSRYRPYILSAGALRWRKGFHFSIEAFVKINQEFPDLKYLIIGKKCSDRYYQRLKNLIHALKLAEKVFIFPDVEREKVKEFFQAAELFGLMSQNSGYDIEGFGLVFLEAAAAGLPVIGSRECGVEDAIRDGRNGFLINSRDINEFASAAIKILDNEDLKEKMANESLQLARSSGWENKILSYEKIYRELLG